MAVVLTTAQVRESFSALALRAHACVLCDLSRSRTTVVFGAGSIDTELVVLGEGPGANEDLTGQPFVGRSGQLLAKLLDEELGLSREQVYITNIVKCRPPENRDPTKAEIASCRPFLVEQLELLDPVVVVTLGNVATRTVLETSQGISKLRGTTNSSSLCRAPVIPTFHPAAGLRGGESVVRAMREDLGKVRALLERGSA